MQNKNKKLSPVPVIHRRLIKLWSTAILTRAKYRCEYCNMKKGELSKNGASVKIDAHHILNKEIKDSPLKYDILNGIGLDPSCHKWGNNSFHKSPVTTITWLKENHPDRYYHILKNSDIRIDLDNRRVLEEIEKKLNAQEPLDLDKLKDIEKTYPRNKPISKQKIKGSLFDSESKSSSSSES